MINLHKFSNNSKIIKILEDLNLTNPSIVKWNNYFYILCRKIIHNKHHDTNFISSKNYLLQLTLTFEQVNLTSIDDQFIRNNTTECKNGLEDGRLFIWKNKIWVLFTGYSFSDHNHSNTMILCEFINNDLINHTILKSPRNANREKNWMPLVSNDDLFFIYSLEPLEIYKFSNQNLVPYVKTTDNNLIHTDLVKYGSTPFIRINNHYLGLAHKKIYLKLYNKIFIRIIDICYRFFKIKNYYSSRKIRYLHFFILLNPDFSINYISEDFYFEKKGIEFASGITIHENELIISYGLFDNQCKLFKTNINQLFNKLKTN